jgi:hypothetical protein
LCFLPASFILITLAEKCLNQKEGKKFIDRNADDYFVCFFLFFFWYYENSIAIADRFESGGMNE